MLHSAGQITKRGKAQLIANTQERGSVTIKQFSRLETSVCVMLYLLINAKIVDYTP
jgi:hypothetical protein